MSNDTNVGDYLLISVKATEVMREGSVGVIEVEPDTVPTDIKGKEIQGQRMVIAIRDVLKNYGEKPCAPCKQDPKHIIAVDVSEYGSTIVKMIGDTIDRVQRVDIPDPYTRAKIISNMVTVPEKTTVIIDNEGGNGEPILEHLIKLGGNGMLAVFKPRPDTLKSVYRAMDLAIRTGELSIGGAYNRFKDGDAEIIRPDDYLKQYYKDNPMALVPKEPCKDCPDSTE